MQLTFNRNSRTVFGLPLFRTNGHLNIKTAYVHLGGSCKITDLISKQPGLYLVTINNIIPHLCMYYMLFYYYGYNFI